MAAKNKLRNSSSSIFVQEPFAVKPMRRQVFEPSRPTTAPSTLTQAERERESIAQGVRRDVESAAAQAKNRNRQSLVFSEGEAPQHRPMRTPQSRITNVPARPSTSKTVSEKELEAALNLAHSASRSEALSHRSKNYTSNIFQPVTKEAQPRPMRTPVNKVAAAQREKAPSTRTDEEKKRDSIVFDQHVETVKQTAIRARQQSSGSTIFSPTVVRDVPPPDTHSPGGKKIVAGRAASIRLDHEELRSDRTALERSFDSDRLRVYHEASAAARVMKARNAGTDIFRFDPLPERPKTAPRAAAIDPSQLQAARASHQSSCEQAQRMRERSRGSGNILSWGQ